MAIPLWRSTFYFPMIALQWRSNREEPGVQCPSIRKRLGVRNHTSRENKSHSNNQPPPTSEAPGSGTARRGRRSPGRRSSSLQGRIHGDPRRAVPDPGACDKRANNHIQTLTGNATAQERKTHSKHSPFHPSHKAASSAANQDKLTINAASAAAKDRSAPPPQAAS